MFDLFKRRKGRGARRRATPSMFAEFLEYFGEAPVLENGPGAQAGGKQTLAGLLLQPALQPGDIVQRDGDDFSDH